MLPFDLLTSKITTTTMTQEDKVEKMQEMKGAMGIGVAAGCLDLIGPALIADDECRDHRRASLMGLLLKGKGNVANRWRC